MSLDSSFTYSANLIDLIDLSPLNPSILWDQDTHLKLCMRD